MNIVNLEIEKYCLEKSSCPSSECESLENFTKNNILESEMLIGKLEASFLGFLIQSISAKRILEIGTFTGYSALAMAENLPNDGELITIELEEKNLELAKTFWEKSLHGKKIKPKLGKALTVLPFINGTFDLIFIDADKSNYLEYLKISLEKLNENGVIIVDNVLWSGRVIESANINDQNTLAIKQLNDFVATNSFLYGTLLPIRDGLFLIKKSK